ncbi:MAG TPA: DUF1552 domain-containing protein [Polyangia bacterium]
MTSMDPLRFTRRNLLRGSLAATAAVPLLDAQRAFGATAAPTRLVVFLTPNGTRNSLFWPSGTETNFKVNTLTQPMDPWKSKLTFLKGIKLNPALQTGELGQTLGSEHARGTGGLLTARPLKSGTQFKSFGNTTSGWGSGQSIDQYLAMKLAPATAYKSFQMGVHVRDTEVRARIAYAAADQPIPPREDPKDVFNALFGGAGAAGGGAANERLWAQRKSIFDANNAETERLKKLVGAEDRKKLDAHLTAMRDVETRLVGMKGSGTSSGGSTCSAKPTLVDVDLKNDDQYEKAGQLQMDLAVAALACDLTRILTFQWSYSESEHLFGFLNITGNHHAISHDFASSGANYDAYNKIAIWYQQQFAYLLSKLDAYKEGDKTLLDNCVVLFATEIGESTQHDLKIMPYVLAGSAGGKLRAGRFIDYGSKPCDNNQLLVSLANLMGATDLTSFGDPSGATGPLPNLT